VTRPPALVVRFAGGRRAPKRHRLVWGALAVLVFAGFIQLGNWQVRRLDWKLKLIADVRSRVHASPVAAPGPGEWPRIGAGHDRYLHVRATGTYLNTDETLVRGTSRLGYGFWLMTPLRTDRGFIVLVNRGYLPSALPESTSFRTLKRPTGEVTITGLLRLTEPGGGFLRPNRPAKGLWYSRDVAAIAAAKGLPAGTVAPYFIDADAQPEQKGWPVGGLTVIHFPNHHLGYAITWYLMALATAICAFVAARNERQRT